MREPTYRDALSHGWYLMVQHKVLWIFGLFAALLGQMGVLDIITKVVVTAKYYTYYPFFANAPLLMNAFVEALRQWRLPFDRGVWLIWLLVVFAAFGLAFLFVAVVCHGALIHSVSQYVRGKFKLAHHESWHAGVKHFGRLLALQVLKKLIITILVLFVGFATYHFILTPSIFYTTLFAFSILFSLFIGSIVSLLVTYAACYIVVEEFKLSPALQSAWQLLKSHSLVSVEVAIIILLMNVIAAVVAAMAIILFKVELALIAVISYAFNSLSLWSIGNTLSALLLTGVLMVIGSFITVFSTSVWTYLFMKMHRHGLVSRLKLLFSRSRA